MTDRMKVRAALAATAARGESTPEPATCSAEAPGTARVLPVDAAMTPRVGRKHFHDTLPLAPKEVVLTFDDGPAPGTTARVLETLKRECARASFILLGRNALAYPQLARRALSEGHTVAHHTFLHPLLNRMPFAAAEAETDRGFAAVDTALYDRFERMPRTPFFRFPGFALAGPARSIGTARNRGFRRRSMGKRLDPDVAAGRAQSCPCPRGSQSGRNRAVPRYQGANRRHARRLSARAEKPRLPSRARRSGGGALSRAERRFLGARVAPSQAS